MPRVSIITPTFNRQDLLPTLWNCIRAQSVQDFEWLVHDGSPQPISEFDAINDPRVRYKHVPEAMTIGAKRNDLCAAANGEIIAQFDDDDLYRPHYIERMVSFMDDLNVDFVKLFGFFLYHRTHSKFGYWDLERDFPWHFRLHPDPGEPITLVKRHGGVYDPWGYGFSYVFYRRVWEAIHFPDKDQGEDQVFADNAVAKFKSAGKQDFACSCLHVIHTSNTSMVFPQQILPTALLQQLFPDFHP